MAVYSTKLHCTPYWASLSHCPPASFCFSKCLHELIILWRLC